MIKLELPVVKFSQDQKDFRATIRSFLQNERLAGTFESKCDSWLSGDSIEFSRKLGQKGWIGMTWPQEYGGGERSAIERYILTEELLAAGAPVAAHWFADRQTGPLFLKYGSEEQKQFFLPQIAKGECFFSIGLSEPNAGSDLAAIRTKAERTDGGWLINGSKIWTSGAHISHYMIVLCRTSPYDQNQRHAGMSQLIVDMKEKGVTVRPIQFLTGEHHFNEVFFENVFVPDNRLIGTEGNGWKQGMAELAYERSGPERILSTYPLLEEMIHILRENEDEAGLKETIALLPDLWTLRNMSMGVAKYLEEGQDVNMIAALVKDLGTVFETNVAEKARLIISRIPSMSSNDRLSRLMAQSILHGPGFTLRGGTTEILRGIVAKGVVAQ
ncbi:acyl-CoA dehydrogenase family protein [Cytobacillus purgationiresistens]|uniref:Alkylation response protein AidB-like acyl-CoA dehydrogenase n=1 Tax=Cytobacillus purgationiresistens TaxID=863449 RepID=A0ABU0AI45_9BACI|nr:acyl-CoA dehydrogenase family protein [Cytobacillus purgationiresistens]MDQ0269750.1 alkylation response protein AidB-like acyl-CoA dehydrogenase [Cytobacillus purgationiresistens]